MAMSGSICVSEWQREENGASSPEIDTQGEGTHEPTFIHTYV